MCRHITPKLVYCMTANIEGERNIASWDWRLRHKIAKSFQPQLGLQYQTCCLSSRPIKIEKEKMKNVQCTKLYDWIKGQERNVCFC